MVSKQDFSEKEWSESYLVYDYNTRHIRQDCEAAIKNFTLCKQTEFVKGVSVGTPKEQNLINLDLYFSVISSVEEQPNWYKLLLDILSCQSILFGQNVLKVLMTAYSACLHFVKTKLISRFRTDSRSQSDRATKLPQLIYLVCLFGFSWHTYRVFDPVLNGQLTYSQHHELAKRIAMPEIVFCFQINTSLIDTSRNLTGRYLDELTGSMRPDKIFKEITYLNASHVSR